MSGDIDRLMTHPPHPCKLEVIINGTAIGYSGTLAGARHFLAVLEGSLDDDSVQSQRDGVRQQDHL